MIKIHPNDSFIEKKYLLVFHEKLKYYNFIGVALMVGDFLEIE